MVDFGESDKNKNLKKFFLEERMEYYDSIRCRFAQSAGAVEYRVTFF